jgi:hypothetical protein
MSSASFSNFSRRACHRDERRVEGELPVLVREELAISFAQAFGRFGWKPSG